MQLFKIHEPSTYCCSATVGVEVVVRELRSELCIVGLDERKLSSCCFDTKGDAGRDVILLRVDPCIDVREEREVSLCGFGIDLGVDDVPDICRDEFTRGERALNSVALGTKTGVGIDVEGLCDALGTFDRGEYDFSS
ncbi:hypothetical protein I4U23_006974 [Adineta vaga]|nr:hypothetical protein I4U23_006974 [Adineta vaga]